MQTFEFIEDYILFIGGYKDVRPNLGILQLGAGEHPFELDAYDSKFFDSVGDGIYFSSKALTTKQASLAERLIVGLRRKLESVGVSLPPSFKYKQPLRTVNPGKSLEIEGEELVIRFPYNSDIIQLIRENKDTLNGSWDPDRSAWIFSVIEPTVSLLVAICHTYDIPVADNVEALYTTITECEKTGYKIELVKLDGKFVIENIPESMEEWLVERGINTDPLKLYDYSAVLGYTVDPSIPKAYSNNFALFCESREIFAPPYKKLMPEILDWAIKVERFPIVLYHPNAVKFDMSIINTKFTQDEILIIDHKAKNIEIPPSVKIIVTAKLFEIESIPLLITMAGLFVGKSRTAFLDKAEKVVWNCEKLTEREQWQQQR